MASEILLWPKSSDDVMVVNCQFLSHRVLVVWRNGHLCRCPRTFIVSCLGKMKSSDDFGHNKISEAISHPPHIIRQLTKGLG